MPTFLVGHVTKDGSLAGPKALEHVVDTVLYFEGERHHSHRVVRAVKNRFGAISELGVFEMTAAGLKAVPNPSAMFLAERPSNASGSAVLCSVEGSRPILVEVQALVSSSNYGTARRMASGLDQQRLSLLLAVLEKRAGLNLAGDDVFVNIAGGMTIDEPACDLGVLAAIASSVRNRVIAPTTAVFGEVGLAGEIRGVAQAALRVREAAQMGFRRCIMPDANIDPTAEAAACELVGVDVGEASTLWSGGRTVGRGRSDALLVSRGDVGRRVKNSGGMVDSGRQASMAWFALARVLFVAAVAYAAAVLRPLAIGPALNVVFALALALLVVLFESRLRDTAVTRVLGALIGCAIGLALARTIASGLFWTDSGDRRVEFLHSFVLIVLPYLGLVLGAEHGEWLDPPRLVSLFRAPAPSRHYKILDTSVIIDGRIADVCETGFIDGMLVVPQFVLKELQLVADSADSLKRNRGRRGLDILQRIQKMSGIDVQISDVDFPDVQRGRSQADRAGADAEREDRHQRLQSEQGRAVARRRSAERQRADQLAEAGRPARRKHEGVHPQGRQGIQPGRRLPRRRHDGRRRQCPPPDRQDHRHRRHQRAADDGRKDDFRPLHR